MELADWTRDLPALQVVAIAGALAALLGWERETAGKPAGLRTHILVGAGAALLVVLGDTAMERFASVQGEAVVQSDPVRILQAVIVGISFLGAGTIVQGRGLGVEGLTTAASVLLTAAIGMTVALGRVPLAVMVTVGAVGVIYLLGLVEQKLGMNRPGTDRERQSHVEQRPQRLQRVPPGSS
jgi:putative Mg2+ transporter-C (MgtC) family protein